MAGLFTELKRRNVFRVAAAYAAIAWLSLELLSIVLPTFGAPDWTLRAVIAILALGFIPAVAFAWAFELTAEGIKRESELDRSTLAESRTRKLDMVVIAVLVAAIGVLAVDRLVLDDRRPARVAGTVTVDRIDSIAVLPFEDFSPGGNHSYLGTGIADTILHSLTQLPGLKVAARTSSFQLAEQKADVAAIGEALGVGAVLEGSVQVVGNQLRIIAQLVRTSDHSHLWSRTFDGTTDDIFATQDVIAAEVVKSLRGDATPAPAPQQRTELGVFELVAEGRHLWQLRNPRDIAEAVRLLERAIAIDPDYAPARAELAAAVWFNALYGALDRVEAQRRAEAEIAKTLELDPNNAQAWSIRGLIFSQSIDRASTIAAYERALELNPSDANTLVWLSQELTMAGLHNESRKHIEEAFRLDRMNMYVRGRYAAALAQTGEPGGNRRALAIIEESVRLEPSNPRVLDDAAGVTLVAGDPVKGAQYALEALRIRPESMNPRGHVMSLFALLDKPEYLRAWGEHVDAAMPDDAPRGTWALMAGDYERFAASMERLRHLHPKLVETASNYGLALALIGRNDDAIDWLTSSLERLRAARYEDNPSIGELVSLGLLSWLHADRGDEQQAEAYRAQMRPLFARLQQNGRPPGIDGLLMETGYYIAQQDFDAAVDALRAHSQTNERLLFSIWRDFPWMAEFVQRADVQELFAQWELEQQMIFERLQQANLSPALFDPSRLDELQ